YRRVVYAINKVFNPILAFDRIEGPIAKAVDTVINRLGIPRALTAVLDATLVPITAWAERTLLFPQRDSAPSTSDTKRKREATAIASPLDSPASMTDQTSHGAENAKVPRRTKTSPSSTRRGPGPSTDMAAPSGKHSKPKAVSAGARGKHSKK
ncbi:MAG TPA: hypothetical protein VH496_16960, partial [Mycobacterium sp.]